jgi:iron uptake system component EfeO
VILILLACQKADDQATDPEAKAILAVKDYTAKELEALASAATALQAAAPAPDADGWSSGETAAIEVAWKDARVRYERVEGAIAVLFPDLDAAIDERYDGFIAEASDDNLFDGEGVTGIHGIERIVWADRHPPGVMEFESALPDYTPAAFPASEIEATDFRDGLCQRLRDDTASMRDQFEPLALDSAAAFRGAIGSVAEQTEKVNLASTGEDESRYAQHTLADMRANLDGGYATIEAFEPWLLSLDGGEEIQRGIDEGFARLQAAYEAVDGDAIPAVPETWNPDSPSEEDLATEYGQLWLLLAEESDPELAGSLVERMTAAADLLGIPRIPE